MLINNNIFLINIYRFWSSRQILLALLCAGAGLFAWWQLRPTSEFKGHRVDSTLPDYIVYDFTAVETAPNGQPLRKLTANQLRHYVKSDRSELDYPRLTWLAPTDPPWYAEAKNGLLFAGGDQIILINQVLLEQRNQAGIMDLDLPRLETEQLELWRSRACAETDFPVRLQRARDTLLAQGMQLWYATPRHVLFKGRVLITLAPTQINHP